ncbi:VaFE repeat-containing surface-anchored protein [Corynebacterium sp. sy039]|uniref:VaFE repeat-containing surface-anchored protein n=1 Tax=Corynebacterium sp. sy039 TaxID=2599641 RepID=UPI0011B4A9A5|nr:VaFE repeat-containing surface-anchored protein [Corynebacterium sp. sy039]QDZ42281.1 hypothetical protein FQV43_03205 [Corynebacterium sp. sy039]
MMSESKRVTKRLVYGATASVLAFSGLTFAAGVPAKAATNPLTGAVLAWYDADGDGQFDRVNTASTDHVLALPGVKVDLYKAGAEGQEPEKIDTVTTGNGGVWSYNDDSIADTDTIIASVTNPNPEIYTGFDFAYAWNDEREINGTTEAKIIRPAAQWDGSNDRILLKIADEETFKSLESPESRNVSAPTFKAAASFNDEQDKCIETGQNIVETITYENLIPNKIYRIDAKLVNEKDETVLGTASHPFTPTESSGTANVVIPVDPDVKDIEKAVVVASVISKQVDKEGVYAPRGEQDANIIADAEELASADQVLTSVCEQPAPVAQQPPAGSESETESAEDNSESATATTTTTTTRLPPRRPVRLRRKSLSLRPRPPHQHLNLSLLLIMNQMIPIVIKLKALTKPMFCQSLRLRLLPPR